MVDGLLVFLEGKSAFRVLDGTFEGDFGGYWVSVGAVEHNTPLSAIGLTYEDIMQLSGSGCGECKS